MGTVTFEKRYRRRGEVRGATNPDVWKVLAGMAADQTIGHWWLGTLGRDLFPVRIGRRLRFTEEMNRAVMVMWPLALVGCVYMGWFAGRRGVGAGRR